MYDDPAIVAEFLVESHEILDHLDRDLVALEAHPSSRELLDSSFRALHTLKGTCSILGYAHVQALAHTGEELLTRWRDGEQAVTSPAVEALLSLVDTARALLWTVERTGEDVTDAVPVASTMAAVKALVGTPTARSVPAAEDGRAPTVPRDLVGASVRVDLELLDRVVQQATDLVATRTQIVRASAGTEDPDLARATARLDAVVRRLHESILMIRMQPVGQLWERVPRVVRDLSRQLGREVEVTLVGEDTRFERSMLEALKAPLVHLLRNCLDHGIETPEERLAAGKPATGRLTLAAGAQDGAGVIEISDDGRGIDRDRLVATARCAGLLRPDEEPDAAAALQLIFRSGLSTAPNLTHVSGRGVGMDVVLTNIEGVGGSVEVISELGVGTTFRIRVPGAASGPGA